MTDALRDAAQAVLDRWDSPQWEWSTQGPTADLMQALRAALAQPAASGEPVAAECDSPKLCALNGACAGQYGTKQQCAIAQPAPARVPPDVMRDAERYRWLRDRLLAADFDYMGEGIPALVFELPPRCAVSADCDATIDGAMAGTPAKEPKP